MLTKESKLMAGITFISITTIMFGGNFILGLLSGVHTELEITPFQENMFRAGHGHAGVLVILSLLALMYVDQTSLSDRWKWIVRAGFPFSAILISGGFFAAAGTVGASTPNEFIAILYAGMLMLAISLTALGIGLIRKP